MVDLVNVLIERPPMERTVRPVMPGVLQYKKDSNLVPASRSVFDDPASLKGHCVGGNHTAL